MGALPSIRVLQEEDGTLIVYDLQFRLRCSHCNARAGFRITIFDTRTRGDNWKPRLERVVVAGE
jgi:hypothetical protein